MSNIHKPSQFIPEDYTVIDYIDANEPANISSAFKYLSDQGHDGARLQVHSEITAFYNLCEKYFGVRSAPCVCDHCGKYARYFAVAFHKPTAKHIAVGHICADNRLGITTDQFRWNRLAERAKASATEIARSTALIELETKDPELHRAWLQAHGDDKDRAGAIARESAILNVVDDRDVQSISDIFHRGIYFLSSVADRVRKNNFNASDKQRAVLISGLAKSREFAIQSLSRNTGYRAHAIAKAELGASAPVLSGRILIRGKIASFKYTESEQWGSTLKFAIHLPSGQTVFVSVPSLLSVWTGTSADREAPWRATVGDTVEFTATVQQSDRDPLFYFGSRPTVTKAYKAWLNTIPDVSEAEAIKIGVKPYEVPSA